MEFTKEELQHVIDAREFGQRLQRLRKKRGFTVEEISQMVGTGRSTFAGYETQEKFPPIEKLSRIAKVLGTSTDFLVGLTDDPFPIDAPKNLYEYIEETKGLHWNGIPLTEEQLKPLAEIFTIMLREEEMKKNNKENETNKNA